MSTPAIQTGPSGEVVPEDLVTLTIDGIEVSVPKGTMIIRAAERIGIQIPRFCDHPLLDPVGACRQCLVEVAMPAPDGGEPRTMMGPPGRVKPQASCSMPVAEGMVVNTQLSSPIADKAQQGVMEQLLINHPLDCPVCDKGGECPLQNQAMTNGRGESRFIDQKRTFPKPINISAQILLDRERCVLCARCTRFSEQIAGDPFIALIERGALQQVGIYEKEPFRSNFAGNTIQICPVGALTSAAYRFRARPFDLVSTPGVGEHDSGGAAIRVDHRRGKIMRRLAGNDPEVNEEWITDKDRFAFTYVHAPDRIAYPRVRDEETGELRTASWPEAFVVAARGLAVARDAGGVGVLTGGRLTREDAYAYAKFSRTALRTNDIDFRSRPHSAEEERFLAAHVAGRGLGVTYADVERASAVLILGLEPEEEAGSLFLRLRKATMARDDLRVFAVAPYTTQGLRKLGATVVRTRPGEEPAAIEQLGHDGELALDGGGVILVGERLAAVPGALGAVSVLAAQTGARLAWVPRRAGDRGALDAGCLPSLLPGGRPLEDAAARVDVSTVWGLDVPVAAGRDGDAVVAALARGELAGAVVGGVELDDLEDGGAARAALRDTFVVSLELRESAVTELADVVFPVAATAEKTGSFTSWEGRVRPFEQALQGSNTVPDVRVLAGIAAEMATPLGFQTTEGAAGELAELEGWDGVRTEAPSVVEERAPRDARSSTTAGDGLLLSTWKTMIGDGPMQEGDPHYLASGPDPTVVASERTLAAIGVAAGEPVTLATEQGSVVLPAAVGDIDDDVVWAPSATRGINLARDLGARGGTRVDLRAVNAELAAATTVTAAAAGQEEL